MPVKTKEKASVTCVFLFALLQFLDNINRKSIFTVGLWFALRQKSSVCTKGADANAFTSPVLFSLGVGGRWAGGCCRKSCRYGLQPPITQRVLRMGKLEKKGRDVEQGPMW